MMIDDLTDEERQEAAALAASVAPTAPVEPPLSSRDQAKAEALAATAVRPKSLDLTAEGLGNVTQRDILDLKDFIKTSPGIRAGKDNFPGVGGGFRLADDLLSFRADMSVRAAKASGEQVPRELAIQHLRDRFDSRRPQSGLEEFGEMALDSATVMTEIGAAMATGGAASGPLATRLAARVGAEASKKYLVAKIVGQGAASAATATAIREYGGRIVGPGGHSTATSLRRALPELTAGIGDEDASALAELTDRHFAEEVIPMVFEKHSLWSGLGEEMLSNAVESVGGPLLGMLPPFAFLKGMQMQVMKKAGAKSMDDVLGFMENRLAMSDGFSEMAEEAIQGLSTEAAYGNGTLYERLHDGMPEARELGFAWLLSTVMGAGGGAMRAAIEKGRSTREKGIAKAEAELAAAQEATAGPKEPAAAGEALEGGDVSQAGEVPVAGAEPAVSDVEPVTDDEFSRFIRTGMVSDKRVGLIAEQIARGDELSEQDVELMNGGIDRVESRLREMRKGNDPVTRNSDDPFRGYGLPVSPFSDVSEQSLEERLGRRSAAQRIQEPLSLADHVLAAGGIDLRETNGMQSEGGDFLERLRGISGRIGKGMPSGLLYGPGSKSKSGGLSPESMREALREQGFTGEDADGRLGFDEMLYALESELAGEEVRFHPDVEEEFRSKEHTRQESVADRERAEQLGVNVEDLPSERSGSLLDLFIDPNASEGFLSPKGAQGSPQNSPGSAPKAPGQQVEIGRSLFGVLEKMPEVASGKRVELPHIMKSLSGIIKAAGSKQAIREGKAANVPQGAAGSFWTRGRMIDIRQANDIGTGAHEVAHSLEQAVYGMADPWAENGKAKMNPSQRAELFTLGKRLYGNTVPNGGYLREGWAEFMRGHIVNDGEVLAPEMTRWFGETFLKERPKVAKAIEKARSQARVWRLQGSPTRVGASIKRREGRIKKTAKAVGTGDGREQLKEDGYDNFVDMFGVYRRGVKKIEAESGKLLSPSQNTHKLASALRQTGPARLEYMIDKGGIDLAGNPTGGPSLRDVKALVKGKGEEFTQYLYARRAKALWEQPVVEKLGPNESVGLFVEMEKAKLETGNGQTPTTEQVLKNLGARDPGISYVDTMETLRVLESPGFLQAAEKVHQWYDGVMDYVAGSSPTFAKAVAAIREKDPGAYMPLKRVFEKLPGRGGSGGGASSGTVSKRLKGSGRQILDPFPQLISQAQRHIDMAHERAVLDSVLQWNKLAPGMDHLVTEVPVEQVPGGVSDIEGLIKEIEKRVDGKSDAADALREELGDSVDEVVTFFMQSRQPSKGDGKAPIVPVMEDGKLKYFQVDAKLFDALAGLHVPQVDSLMKWMAATSKRMFTAGTTGLNPAFTLITNPLRDVATYAAQTQAANPVEAFTGYISGIGEALLGAATGGKTPTQFWDAFERLGVKMSQRYAEDNARTENVANRLAGGGKRVVNFAGDSWNYVVEAMNFPEAAPRIAEMKIAAKRVGWTPGTYMTLDQAVEIGLAGKRISVDFSAAGKIARDVNKYVPFHNVAFQSMRSYTRSVKDNPAKAVAVGFAAFTLPTVAMWLQNKDEEWYQEMEDKERYTYFFSGLDDGGLMKFPRSFEPHFIFATIPEILLNNLNRVNPEAAETLAKQLTDSLYQIGSEAKRTFTPNFLPVAAQVGAEQLANKVFYFDSPIVGRAEERRAPEEQYNEYTSKGAIWLGELLGQSPARVSHAINGFTGTVGREIQNLTGSEMDDMGREQTVADWPIAGRLFKKGGQDEVRSRTVSRVYDEQAKAVEIQNSLKVDETPEQRERRLFVGDVAKLMTGMSTVRRFEPSKDKRAAVARKRRDLAQEAMARLDDGTWRSSKGKFKQLGKSADKEKRSLKADLKERMKSNAQR